MYNTRLEKGESFLLFYIVIARECKKFPMSLRASVTSVAINDSGRPIRLIASGYALAMTENLESFGILPLLTDSNLPATARNVYVRVPKA